MKRLFALLLVFCLLLAGCGVTEPQGKQTQPSDSEQPSQSTGSTEKPDPELPEFSFQVYEERGFGLELPSGESIAYCVIRSVEELKDWVRKSLPPEENLPDWIGDYDDAFFETNSLINVLVQKDWDNRVCIEDIIPDEAGNFNIAVEVYSVQWEEGDVILPAVGSVCFLIEVNRVIEDPKAVTPERLPIRLTKSEWKEKFGEDPY